MRHNYIINIGESLQKRQKTPINHPLSKQSLVPIGIIGIFSRSDKFFLVGGEK